MKVFASALTSSVLPRPGTPSSSTWPAYQTAGEHLVDHGLLAYHGGADLVAHAGDDADRLGQAVSGNGRCGVAVDAIVHGGFSGFEVFVSGV
ncbi:hypothetical protein LP419_03770 [Massilia sp. H-1]|nr:hypothetical protein LP419_03770 [Massilia sp. H-1]